MAGDFNGGAWTMTEFVTSWQLQIWGRPFSIPIPTMIALVSLTTLPANNDFIRAFHFISRDVAHGIGKMEIIGDNCHKSIF